MSEPIRRITSEQIAEMHRLLDQLKQTTDTPTGRGWARLHTLLQGAMKDPVVGASLPAVEFLAGMIALVGDAITAQSADEALEPLKVVLAAEVKSKTGKQGADAKNAATNAARDWVVSEWQKHSAAYEGNKSAFAEHYVARLRHERGVTVKAKTIAFTWLLGK
jgi:hypothetical protein